MAHRWAIRLVVFGVFVLFLVVPGVEVGHFDTFSDDPPPITFLQIWWFWWEGMSHRTATRIAYAILIGGGASFLTGIGLLGYQRWRR